MHRRAQIGVCLALLAGALRAQIPTGAIAGSVRDPSGAALSGAAVTVLRASINSTRETTTDAAGVFKVTNLTPGTYEVSVSKPGFRNIREPGVQVQLDRTAQIALVMEVGEVTESVDVPSKTGVIETDDSGTVSELLAFSELIDIIQDTRTITDLGYLVSGVSRRASGGLGGGFVVGGARADNTNYIVDGFSDYDPRSGGAQAMPVYDAVDEFRVQVTGSAAEYGRLAGGVMNIVLRSGTNRVHGSLFEFYRSDALAARNFFDTTKSRLLSDQFGATLSGPVTIPHLYSGRDRTFFLISWEALRQNYGGNRFSLVPTARERNGDFSATTSATGSTIVLRDPLTGSPFPRNLLPANRIDPIARTLTQYFPLPNSPDPVDNYHADDANHSQWNNVLVKLDEHATENDAISLRYLTRPAASANPYTGSDLGLFGSHTQNRSSLAGLNYTRIFGPTLVNEFRAGFVRTSDHETGVYAGQDINGALGLPSPDEQHLFGFPRFTVLNLAPLGDSTAMPVDFTVNNYEIADAVSSGRGRHVLKFGADFLRTQFFQQLNNNTRGSFNFLGRWTNVPFADFLLGMLDSASRQTSSNPTYLFSSNVGAFAQDEFSVTSRLTLHYGLRVEFARPPYEKYGRMSSFVPELGQLVIADARTIPNLNALVSAASLTGRVTTAAQAGLPHPLVYPNNWNLAPRFGFALRIKPNLVLRGGYGIYYADSLLDPVRNDLTNVYPFTVSQTFNRVASQPANLTLQDPFPARLATLPGVTNVYGFELHPRPQYLQSYTMSLEQQIGQGTTVQLEYAGSHGTHLARQYDLNQTYRVASLRQPNGTYPRPYAGFGSINFFSFGANSIYNSGSITLRRRYRNGFFYGLTYIYSKSIDDASQVAGNSTGDYPGAQDSRDLAAERARSDWDTGHSLLVFGSYTLPFARNAWTRGWQLSTTTRLYTGQPFTPRVANANPSLGEPGRPDRIAKGTVSNPGINDWFDLSAFPVVPRSALRFGDSGRNILDGPGTITVNLALSKGLRIADKANLNLRAEAINVLNHANFGLPVDYVDVRNAGQILSADAGRTIQLGLRLRF